MKIFHQFIKCMRMKILFLFFEGKKPCSNAEVTHSEKGKQSVLQAPIFQTDTWSLTLDLAPALQGPCLLPPSAAQQTCSGLFSLLMLCHFVQYSSFKRARIVVGLLASPQDYLVFCLLCNKLIGLLSFLSSFCFSTCFCAISSTGFPEAD